MADAGSTPVVLRGSLAGTLKVLAWLAVGEVFATMNSGWPQGVMLTLGLLIAFTPALAVELRIMLIVAVILVVTVLFAPLSLHQRFGLATVVYLGVAAGTLAAWRLGGTQLRLDSRGVTVKQVWATTRLPWSDARPDLLADLSGRPVGVVLQREEGRPFYLPESYGLPPAELAAVMNRIRAGGLAALH